MATKSRYLLQIHLLVNREDLPQLPQEIQEDFETIYKQILQLDPYRCGGFPSADKQGNLSGYRALEIDWLGVAYRLIYRIYEKPAPKRVFIISFGEHDTAYDRAKERIGK
ncbi:MAG TPA: hypothetical protein IGS52_05050 [Oscillatoriaceae cyanobacterium M33_DOE_052]|nr:hypothetical protein [Oscillatoriaceae cyanobacterium M33_DOE_052]